MASTLLLLVALLVTLAASSPLELTGETWQNTIDNGNPVFVKFYAPWCGHCKSLAPTWDQLADQYQDSNIVIAKIDCTTHTTVCADNGIKGYPTLKLFRGGDVWDHRNARDLKSLSEFISSHVGETQSVQPKALTDATFPDYMSATPGLHFVKFYAPWCGHCQKLAPVWEQLAREYSSNPSVHISKVDCTQETGTCGQLEVKGYPTLLLLVNGVLVQKYSGSRDLESLTSFITEALVSEEPPQVKGVVELTEESFGSALIENQVVFVKFYAPWCGHCKHLAPVWDQLAEAVHTSFTTTIIAKVDCTVDKELCSEHQVHGYPTLVLFKDGQRFDYREARDYVSLLNFVQTYNN